MRRVYAVASGKGGVGKTTTVANLGVVLAAGGHETVVIDADLGMGNLAGVLGTDADTGQTVHDVLSGSAGVADAVREGPAGLSVVPASNDLDDFAAADPANLSALLDGIDAEIILVDTSAGLSHDSVEPLRVADEVLLVSTPTRGSLGDTAKTREVAGRFETTVTGAVLTRTTPETDPTTAGARLDVPLVVSADSEATDIRARGDVADLLLVDSTSESGAGGTGETHDWHRTRDLVSAIDTPVVLAGGLTPENVRAAVETVDPFAVDVASGVERRPGRKKNDAVRQFVAEATGGSP
jgi:septum site-determining protein MinD